MALNNGSLMNNSEVGKGRLGGLLSSDLDSGIYEEMWWVMLEEEYSVEHRKMPADRLNECLK